MNPLLNALIGTLRPLFLLILNSGKYIAESKSFTHEAYCFRNIIRCPKCDEPINKNEVELHEQEVHKLVLFSDK